MSLQPTRQTVARARIRAAAFETLESRQYMNGYFDNIADSVSGEQGALAAIRDSLKSVGNAAQRLPLINKSVQSITEITDSLENVRAKLDNKLRSFTPGAAEDTIRTELFNILGTALLGDKNESGTVDKYDIYVTVNGTTSVDVSMDIAKSVTFGSNIGLGLDAVPFKPGADAGGGFTIGLAYRNLNFGYKNGGAYFTTASPDELQFKILGRLPQTTFHAGLGFINFDVTDGTPGVDDLNLTLTADVTPSFTIANARLDGGVNLLLKLGGSFSAPGLPKFKTDLKLDWVFPTVVLGGIGRSTPGFGIPSLALNNVQMNLGSMMGGLVQPIAQRIQVITEPLQPVLDLVKKRIPALSDLSETMGGPQIDLVTMSNVLSAMPNPPTEFINAIKMADKLRHISETVNALAGQGGDSWLQLGNYNISGPGGSSLLSTASAALGNLGLGDWSSLIFNGGSVSFDAIKQQIRDLVGPDVGNEINKIWDALSGESGGSGVTFDFPVIKNPTGVALSMLLGKDTDLVSLTGRLHLGFDRTFNLVPVPGIIVGLQAAGNVDAYAKIGYDTRGLREAIAPMYGGGLFDANKLMRGLWIDRNTGVDADGRIRVAAGGGIPDIAELTVGGEFRADVHVKLSTKPGLSTDQIRIRPLAGELGDHLFDLNGKMEAAANVRLKAGFSLFGEWIGIDKTWDFAKKTMFEFSTNTAPIPSELNPVNAPPPVIAFYDPNQRTLTLAAGPEAWRRGTGLDSIIDETFTVKRVTRNPLSFIDGNGARNLPMISTYSTNSIEVSAFGMTQRFTQPIDKVIALMGSGRDRLEVYDPSGKSDYIIDTGNDNADNYVDVDGRVNVYVNAYNGNDTIDAGEGKDQIIVHAGYGNDVLSLGDGKLSNINPAAGYIYMDGHAGKIWLDNSAESADTDYFLYDDPNSSGWTVTATVRGSGVSRSLNFAGLFPRLTSGAGNDNFYGTLYGGQVYGGAGDDKMYPDYYSPGKLPVLKAYYNFYGQQGDDTLVLNNNNVLPGQNPVEFFANNYGDQVVRWGAYNANGLAVNAVEQIDVNNRPDGYVAVKNWGGGIININQSNNVDVYTDNYQGWETHINIKNTPRINFIDQDPDSGPSVMGIDATGPYMRNGSGPKLHVSHDDTTGSVGFYGTRFTIDPEAGYVAKPWNVDFAGWAGKSNRVTVQADPTLPTARDYSYKFDGQALTIGGLNVPLNNVNVLWMTSGRGNDSFEFNDVPTGMVAMLEGGAGNDAVKVGEDGTPFSQMRGSVYFAGGDGTDSIFVNDRGATTGQGYTIASAITNGAGGSVGQFNGPVESMSFAAVYYYPGYFSVEGHSTNWTVDAGIADDEFHVRKLYNYVTPLKLNGGEGQNLLAIYNDSPVFPVKVYSDQVRFSNTPDARIDYTGMTSLEYKGGASPMTSPPSNQLYVRSLPADVMMLIHGHAAAFDTFVIGSDDGVTGSLSDLGLGVYVDGLGQPAGWTDKLKFIDTSETVGHTFDFRNGQLFRDNVAILTGMYGIEQLDLQAGQGHDKFKIHSFNKPTGVSIYGNGGFDNLDWTPETKDVQANIVQMASFSYDGGEGYDWMALYNDNNPGAWTYTMTDQYLRVQNGGYYLILNHANTEYLMAVGGAAADRFDIPSTIAYPSWIIAQGGLGANKYNVGENGSTQNIRGNVQIYGNASDPGELLTVDNSHDTQDRKFHVDQYFVNGDPGDNLLGPGGYLYYPNVVNVKILSGLGNDEAYVRAHETSNLNIDMGGQHGVDGGDFIGFAFAGAENRQFSSDNPGSGTWTFSNRKPLSYSGVEGTAIDDVGPVVLSGAFVTSPQHALKIQFSDDVSHALSTASLSLIDTATGEQVTYGYRHLSYDLATNIATFTFDGYPGGALPAGNYHAEIGWGTDDFYGNNLGQNYKLDFTVNGTGDTVAPTIVSSKFDLTDAGAARLMVQFSEDVSASLNDGYLRLQNLTSGSYVSADSTAVSWDSSTNTATWTFPGYNNGVLPGGFYAPRIQGGLTDAAGNVMPQQDLGKFIFGRGTAGSDNFRVAVDPESLEYKLFVNDDSTPAITGTDASPIRIVLFGGAGDDECVIDRSDGNAIAPGGFVFEGGVGDDTMGVLGSYDADNVVFKSASIFMNGSTADHRGVEDFWYETSSSVYDTLVVKVPMFYMSGSQHFESLTIGTGATVNMMDASAESRLVARGLNMASQARLDLNDTALVVDYTGASAATQVRSLLTSGGIVSSTAAASGKVIGYAETSSLFSSFPAMFNGEEVDNTTVVARLTIGGDTNLDGTVNVGDLGVLATNWQKQSGATLADGDLNGDGKVDVADLGILATNWQSSTPLPSLPFAKASRGFERAMKQVGLLG